MLNLSVSIEGKTTADLEDALYEVKRMVSEDYTSGHSGNDTGSYSFSVTGEEEEEEEDDEGDRIMAQEIVFNVFVQVDETLNAEQIEEIRSNVFRAVRYWRDNMGLTPDDSEGIVGEIGVEHSTDYLLDDSGDLTE